MSRGWPLPGGRDAARPGTSGWAVATLLLSLTVWPLAIVTGLVALSQTRCRQRRGRGLAVAGLALALVWAVGTAAVVLLAGTADRTRLAQVLAARGGDVSQLAGVPVGQCFDDLVVGVKLVPCEGPHAGELFLTGTLRGDGTVGYPGDDYLEGEARQLCESAFPAYVGRDFATSQFSYATFVPDAESWAAGERLAACAIRDLSGGLVGRAAGSGL